MSEQTETEALDIPDDFQAAPGKDPYDDGVVISQIDEVIA